MDLQLKGKLALISGSTAGIGLAIATSLAREGAHVIINGRAKSSVDKVVAEVKAATKGDVQGFAGDLSQAAVAEELARLPECRDPGQQPGHLRAQSIRGDPGCRLDAVLRRERAERRAARAALPAGDEAGQLGPHHLYLERERRADSSRDDPLRDDEGRPDRRRPRPGRGGGRHPHHRQQRAARPDEMRGVDEFVGTLAKSSGQTFEQFEKEFFEKVRPTSLIKRFASADEVASLVTYIASPLAAATTGSALRVDGGVVKSAF